MFEIPVWMKLPRTTLWALVTVVLMMVLLKLSPVQLPVILYKVVLIAAAAVVGYWIDRGLFPYARPDGYLKRDWRLGIAPGAVVDYPVWPEYTSEFCVAMIRRALIVGAVIIGVALGL